MNLFPQALPGMFPGEASKRIDWRTAAPSQSSGRLVPLAEDGTDNNFRRRYYEVTQQPSEVSRHKVAGGEAKQ